MSGAFRVGVDFENDYQNHFQEVKRPPPLVAMRRSDPASRRSAKGFPAWHKSATWFA
jgi:hypothetical protein